MREEVAVLVTASVLGLVVGGLFALLMAPGIRAAPVMYQAGCFLTVDLGARVRVDSYNLTILGGPPGPAPKRPVYTVSGGGVVAERLVFRIPGYVALDSRNTYIAVATIEAGGRTWRVFMHVATEPCFVVFVASTGAF